MADDDPSNDEVSEREAKKLKRKEQLKKALERGKKLASNAVILGMTFVICAFLSVTFLAYNDKMCNIGSLAKGNLSDIRFAGPGKTCPEPDRPTPGPDDWHPDPDPEPDIVEPTLRDVQRQFERILQEVRTEQGEDSNTVPSVAFRRSLNRRIADTGGLLEDLYAVDRARADLGFESGAPRKATTPRDTFPPECFVGSKPELANELLLIRASNGHQIVRRSRGGIPDGDDVFTDMHMNVEDGLRLGLDQSGDTDNYSRVWVLIASEADRDADPCP